MSATSNTEMFSNYFFNCPIIEVPAQRHQVTVNYLEDILKWFNINVDDYDFDKSIDYSLIADIIEKIDRDRPKNEEVLVFLPGLEEICQQRSHLNEEMYQIFVLHSRLQKENECDFNENVFVAPRNQNKRTIILATNIAETSVTFDRLVHVIDTGKLKELHFAQESNSSELKLMDISQAVAKQRKGRCGRVRAGICYRLYTKSKFDSFALFPTSEITRMDLTDLCVLTKCLIEKTIGLEFFFSFLPTPPPTENVQHGIAMAKQIGALNSKEELTNLGEKLTEFPIECRLGKLILFAIALRCVSPILTVASALSIDNIFAISRKESKEERHSRMDTIKSMFAQDKISDIKVILGLHQKWLEQPNNQLRRKVCTDYNLSPYAMDAIHYNRNTLTTFLTQKGYISLKMSDLNQNNWKIIQSVLVAASYPNLFQLNNEKIIVRPDHCFPHKSSILYDKNTKIKKSPHEWFVYQKKIGSFAPEYVNITGIDEKQVLLFGGTPFILPKKTHIHSIHTNLRTIHIDNNIEFVLTEKDAKDILAFRQKIYEMMDTFLFDPTEFVHSKKLVQNVSETIETLKKFLENEPTQEIAPLNDEINIKYVVIIIQSGEEITKAMNDVKNNWRFTPKIQKLVQMSKETDPHSKIIIFFYNRRMDAICYFCEFIAIAQDPQYEFILPERHIFTKELFSMEKPKTLLLDKPYGNKIHQTCIKKLNE